MSNPEDRYLWDGQGEPDAELRHIEKELRRFRWKRQPLRLERKIPFPFRYLIGLAALVLGVAAVGFLFLGEDEKSIEGLYRLEILEGSARVERATGEFTSEAHELRPGERVHCDAGTRARVVVGDIGDVVLAPRSRLRVKSGDPSLAEGSYQLALENGTVVASIFAAPRIFWLETPAAIAVDLGCVYTATVDETTGATFLSVISGQVSFEASGREVFVPTDAVCRAYPERGPGTPYWNDASPEYREAIDALDRGTPWPQPLAVVLANPQPRDTLTLWHLLDHPERGVRQAVFEQLAKLSPPPANLDREALLHGDRDQRGRWKDALEGDW